MSGCVWVMHGTHLKCNLFCEDHTRDISISAMQRNRRISNPICWFYRKAAAASKERPPSCFLSPSRFFVWQIVWLAGRLGFFFGGGSRLVLSLFWGKFPGSPAGFLRGSRFLLSPRVRRAAPAFLCFFFGGGSRFWSFCFARFFRVFLSREVRGAGGAELAALGPGAQRPEAGARGGHRGQAPAGDAAAAFLLGFDSALTSTW